jgi:hypothetical protein
MVNCHFYEFDVTEVRAVNINIIIIIINIIISIINVEILHFMWLFSLPSYVQHVSQKSVLGLDNG